jgi:hypothetical protein
MKYIFLEIDKVILKKNIIPITLSLLSKAGNKHQEAFVLWAGRQINSISFIVETVLYPKQNAFQTNNGIGVFVSGDELYKLNKWLYNNKQVFISQVHTHPSDAFHSETDNAYPIVTAIGQFSIVIPNFALEPKLSLNNWAFFRLNIQGKWIKLYQKDINEIFRIEDECH